MKDKKIIRILIYIIGITLIIIGLAIIAFNKYNKSPSIKETQDMIGNIFFYLPEEEYNNLDEIPSYCKISLVYGSKLLKYDELLSTNDYNTIVKRKNKLAVEAYKKSTITNAVKQILGKNATVSYDENEQGEYEFLKENGCGYQNDAINELDYNEISKYIYSHSTKNKNNNSKLYIKWDKPQTNNDSITLTARALLPVKEADGKYTVYADKDLELVAGSIDKNANLEKEIEKMYKYRSRVYEITLKKEDNKYIWTKYKIYDNIYNNQVFVD